VLQLLLLELLAEHYVVVVVGELDLRGVEALLSQVGAPLVGHGEVILLLLLKGDVELGLAGLLEFGFADVQLRLCLLEAVAAASVVVPAQKKLSAPWLHSLLPHCPTRLHLALLELASVMQLDGLGRLVQLVVIVGLGGL